MFMLPNWNNINTTNAISQIIDYPQEVLSWKNAGTHLGGRIVACSQISRGFGGLLVTQMKSQIKGQTHRWTQSKKDKKQRPPAGRPATGHDEAPG